MTHAEIREREKLIQQDYLSGMSRSEIKKKYNISSIGYAVRNIKRERTDWTGSIKHDISEIIKLHNEGLNHQQIGEKLNTAATYIVTKLKSVGIKPYKIKRAKKTKGIFQRPKFIREELPPRLEAIRERYKKMEIINESNQTMSIRQDDLPFNVRPTSYKRNYSQIIFR